MFRALTISREQMNNMPDARLQPPYVPVMVIRLKMPVWQSGYALGCCAECLLCAESAGQAVTEFEHFLHPALIPFANFEYSYVLSAAAPAASNSGNLTNRGQN